MKPPDLSGVRSFLFTPGHQPERFDKALASGAGAVILDLEDAVPPTQKTAARAAVGDWLSTRSPVLLRINGVHSQWHEHDLGVAQRPGVAGIVLSKAESAEQIARVCACCPGIPILALVETAQGVLNCVQIAAQPSVTRLIFGAIDFCLDLDIAMTATDALDSIRLQLVLASRAARIAPPVDGVTPEFGDSGALRIATERARALGFGAKLCIHPAQVVVVNAAFRPADDEVQWAQRVLRAGEASGFAATALDGQMLDAPLFARAARIVAEAGAAQNPCHD